jgi:hypothetical protein
MTNDVPGAGPYQVQVLPGDVKCPLDLSAFAPQMQDSPYNPYRLQAMVLPANPSATQYYEERTRLSPQ